MDGIFGIDSPLMNALNKFMNIVILNLCFLLSCLPLVTAGAAMTALYSVHLKMVKDEEVYVFSSYWKAFRGNFKQSTICFLLCMAVGAVFVLDFYVVAGFPGIMASVFKVALTMLLVVYLIVFLYVFPYMARFRDSLRISLKNALLIGGANIAYTITVMLIIAACFALTFMSVGIMLRALFIWIVGGFSLLAYICSFFFRRVFDKY